MGLSQTLVTAGSGLRATQGGLSLIASNVANADTPGYVRKTLDQQALSSGSLTIGVRLTGVSRELDDYLQKQLRTESSGAAYATQMSSILNQLQIAYGTPGDDGTLETAFSNFTTALQGLSTSSGSPSSQNLALSTAQALATQLNSTSQSIQALRSNVEQDISLSVDKANSALGQIQDLNAQLHGLDKKDPTAAALMDQRDQAIADLSQLMDIRVITDDANTASVFTTTGVQLVGLNAAQFQFNAQGALNASSLYNMTPSKSGVGTLSIILPGGATTDMTTTNKLISGRIAADLKLRDQTLVQAQSQLDQLAATLASALSDSTTNGATYSSPPQAGFDVDVSNLQPGNKISLTYTDTATSMQHQVTIIRVDDPAALPLPNTATSDPNDKVIGVDFTGGLASVATQLGAALGNVGLQFSAQPGNILRMVDNGANIVTVNAASATTTATALANGQPQLPVFTDGPTAYTGQITSSSYQWQGFAGRIMVNPALTSDPTKFTMYSTSPATTAGDTTRSDYLYTQLTSAQFTYSPASGLGSTASPFSGTITRYLQQVLSFQANQSTNAQQLKAGQDIVVNALQQRFDAGAKVNIDTEMAHLISLQNTYAANAHVMSAVQSMMQMLMQIQV